MFILNQNKLLLNKPTINLENKIQKTKKWKTKGKQKERKHKIDITKNLKTHIFFLCF